MQLKEKGGKLDNSSIDSLSEKRSHRQYGEGDWAASKHGHLYATDSAEKAVSLPSRPEMEVPEEWERIKASTTDEITNMGKILQKDLTSYLQQNAVGTI